MILGLLLVLLAQLLGTGVFMVYIDNLGRRVLLLAGMLLYSILFRWFMSVVRENVYRDIVNYASSLVNYAH